MITVTLPFPISVNAMYANTPNGRVKTEAGKAFARECQEAMMEAGIRRSCPEPPYVLSVWFMVPDNRIRDASNIIKAVEDNLAGYLGYNDSLHHALHVYKAKDENNPRCVVRLEHKSKRIPRPPDVRDVLTEGLRPKATATREMG